MFVTDLKGKQKVAELVHSIIKGEIETSVLKYSEFDGRDTFTTAMVDLTTGNDPTSPGSRLRPETQEDVVSSLLDANLWISNHL